MGDFKLVNVSSEYLLEPTLVELGEELSDLLDDGA